MNIWDQVLDRIRATTPQEDFHRWFGSTSYASDSGDQVTVWVPSEAIRRHISVHYETAIDRALLALGRSGTHVRLLVGGGDDEDEGDEV